MKNVSLGHRWKNFFVILLDPWVLTLFVASVVTGFMTTKQSSPLFTGIMTLVTSAIAGMFSRVLSMRWSDINDEKVLSVRGTIASRELSLLHADISHLITRTQTFLSQNQIGVKDPVVSMAFEEKIDRSVMLRIKNTTTKQNWMDILYENKIPELVRPQHEEPEVLEVMPDRAEASELTRILLQTSNDKWLIKKRKTIDSNEPIFNPQSKI